MAITYQPIGIIHTPFKSLEGMPIQPAGAEGASGWIELDAQYQDGLQDLEGFSHLYLLYHFHQAPPAKLIVTPFLDKQPHGVFATRAPARPNPIGLSLVELVRVEGCRVTINRVDMLDGTPLLDIKPYVPEFEAAQNVRTGWVEASQGRVQNHRSDGRFAGGDEQHNQGWSK
jgi:tRNA-Thr(GGU) m(6)t(6)A37 methyltransferase TsaA